MPAPKETARDEDLRPIIPGAQAVNGYRAYRKSLTRNNGSGNACMPGLNGKCTLCGTGDCTQQPGHE